MQFLSTRARFVKIVLVLSAALLGTSTASAQSAADNIRPVGQVCMAGQPCVGSPALRASQSSIASANEEVEVAPEAEEVPVVEESVAEPAAVVETAATESDFDVAGRYQMSCFACHGTGAAGAPVLGDAEAWNARLEKGMDALMANVINGINAMPAKGLCMDCSDDNLRSLVDYMITQ